MGTKNKWFLYKRGNGKIYNNKTQCEKENSKEFFPIRGCIRGYPRLVMAENAIVWFSSPKYQLEQKIKNDMIKEKKAKRDKDTRNKRNKEEKEEEYKIKKKVDKLIIN
jgi:hypothetical protein